ncbi:hypothetical protein OPV22_027306 [Ensete ventricosum]|uniref:Uncharacterized protein n=1 Tax=Ensete ventricosum TaxID=4639 RepID=A0AAV8Q743_ENSVE|nr:hypothetical protein OPV22_027306 [Ensete ventricosum]
MAQNSRSRPRSSSSVLAAPPPPSFPPGDPAARTSSPSPLSPLARRQPVVSLAGLFGGEELASVRASAISAFRKLGRKSVLNLLNGNEHHLCLQEISPTSVHFTLSKGQQLQQQ